MIKAKKRAPVAQPIDPAKLKGYVDRIESVETRIVEERDARADIYTEVKASGLKPKMVRKLVKERAKKEEDAAELAELERYRVALSMPGATYRSVAGKTGVPRSTLHRLVPKNKNGTETPHDPETGEVIGQQESCGGVEGHAGLTQSIAPGQHEAPSLLSAGEATGLRRGEDGVGVEPGPQDLIQEPRSPVLAASDAPEPVVPTGNEGRAGERDLIQETSDGEYRADDSGASGAGSDGSADAAGAQYQQHLDDFRRSPDHGDEAKPRARLGAVASHSDGERVASSESYDPGEIPYFLRRSP